MFRYHVTLLFSLLLIFSPMPSMANLKHLHDCDELVAIDNEKMLCWYETAAGKAGERFGYKASLLVNGKFTTAHDGVYYGKGFRRQFRVFKGNLLFHKNKVFLDKLHRQKKTGVIRGEILEFYRSGFDSSDMVFLCQTSDPKKSCKLAPSGQYLTRSAVKVNVTKGFLEPSCYYGYNSAGPAIICENRD